MPLSYLGLAKWFIAVVSALLLTGLARSTAQGQTLLMGGGATFPHPIYARWIAEEYRAKRGMAILHFPTVLGADVPIYNIPGVAGELKFTPEALVGIFLGKITKWDDPRLTKTNLEAKLPKHDIVVAFWSDGSGTTYIWTDYLAKVSEEWNSDIGFATTVPWPVGLAGRGNGGVAAIVKQTPYSIGYVFPAMDIDGWPKTYSRAPICATTRGSRSSRAGRFQQDPMRSVCAAAADCN